MTIKIANQLISFAHIEGESLKVNAIDLNKEYGMEYRIGFMSEGKHDTFVPRYFKRINFVRTGQELVSGWHGSVEMAHSVLIDPIQPDDEFFRVRHLCKEFVVILANFKIRGVTSNVKREMRKEYQRPFVDCVISALKGDRRSKQIVQNALCGYIYTKFVGGDSGANNSVTVFDVLNTYTDLEREVANHKRFTQKDLSKGYLTVNYKHLDLNDKKRDVVSFEQTVAA